MDLGATDLLAAGTALHALPGARGVQRGGHGHPGALPGEGAQAQAQASVRRSGSSCAGAAGSGWSSAARAASGPGSGACPRSNRWRPSPSSARPGPEAAEAGARLHARADPSRLDACSRCCWTAAGTHRRPHASGAMTACTGRTGGWFTTAGRPRLSACRRLCASGWPRRPRCRRGSPAPRRCRSVSGLAAVEEAVDHDRAWPTGRRWRGGAASLRASAAGSRTSDSPPSRPSRGRSGSRKGSMPLAASVCEGVGQPFARCAACASARALTWASSACSTSPRPPRGRWRAGACDFERESGGYRARAHAGCRPAGCPPRSARPRCPCACSCTGWSAACVSPPLRRATTPNGLARAHAARHQVEVAGLEDH